MSCYRTDDGRFVTYQELLAEIERLREALRQIDAQYPAHVRPVGAAARVRIIAREALDR